MSPPARAGLDRHVELVAVEDPQPFVDIANPDATLEYVGHQFRRDADPVVFQLYLQPSAADGAAYPDRSAVDFRTESVLDRVLDQGLQQHAWNEGMQRIDRDLLGNLELISEANDFDAQVVVNEGHLLVQWRKRVFLSKKAAQDG